MILIIISNKNMQNTNPESVRALLEAGLSIIPITEGEKRPHVVCLTKNPVHGTYEHDLLTQRASIDEVEKWLKADVKSWAIAGGAVSGNLVTLDFDEKHYLGLYDLWYAKLSGEQKEVVDTCYKNSTRNHGTHLRYLTKTSHPSGKLARKVETNKITGKEGIVTTAETKAEGGYALIPPSVGYITLQGDLLKLPLVSDEMHEELIDILRTFDEVEDEPATEYEWNPSKSTDTDRPGDRLNNNAKWNEILEPHGWVEESKNHWRRPGKDSREGISATTDYDNRPMFYVFSTSASPFEANRGYSKFHAFTLLNHKGNFKEAAGALAATHSQSDIKNGDVLSIEAIEESLQQIPKDTPKIQLLTVLGPVFKKLAGIDKITAEIFVLNNIKEYFGITKGEAGAYIPHLSGLRARLIKDQKEAKNVEERVPLIVDRDIDYQEAYEAISEIGIINEDILKIVIAVTISADLRLSPPLWLFLIGVPSSFKTELVGLFSAMDGVYTLDTVTENAFCSGYVPPDGSETQDLLPLLDNKCFIIKDLNTLFSMNEEMVKKILGDLTSIFDGKFQKFTATRGLVEYFSLFSMIGCVTPSILIKHYNYATALGPRFLFLRLPDLTEEEVQAGLDKFWNETKRKEKIINARQIVSSYCTQLVTRIKESTHERESNEIQEKINAIALFICKCRGIAISKKSEFTNDKGEKIEFYEITDWQVEQPWRIINQLKELLRILSFINGKTSVGDEEIRIIRIIILSTMPVDRAEVLNILAFEAGLTAGDIGKKLNKSSKTARRTLKELETLGVTDCYRDPKFNKAGRAPWQYVIHSKFAGILDAPTPPPECLSLLKSVIGEFDDPDEDEEDEAVTAVTPSAVASNGEIPF